MIALPTVQLVQRGKILIEGTFFRGVGAGWAGWPIALPDIVGPNKLSIFYSFAQKYIL